MSKNKEKIIITKESPVTITQEFITFLEYIKSNQVKLTKTREYITRKHLMQIYSLIGKDKHDVSPKGDQIDYPVIHLFFHLGLELDLIRKIGTKGNIFLEIEPNRFSPYKKLTESEQYVTLLEMFWVNLDWEDLQAGYFKMTPYNTDFLLEMLDEFAVEQEIQLSNHKDLNNLLYEYEHFLYYFDYFGFWKVIIDEEASYQPERPRYAKSKSIQITLLLKKLIPVLLETWNPSKQKEDMLLGFMKMVDPLFSSFNETDDLGEESQTIPFLTLLQPLFVDGELKRTLPSKSDTFVAGSYLFEVSLHRSCWRKLQLSGSHTLLDLHNLIQEAFGFNNDHLYSFFMDGKRFSKNAYNSPMDFQGPYVHQQKIGNLNLYEKQNFLYLFDFGAEWHFNIQVTNILVGSDGVTPMVLDGQGSSPEQYS